MGECSVGLLVAEEDGELLSERHFPHRGPQVSFVSDHRHVGIGFECLVVQSDQDPDCLLASGDWLDILESFFVGRFVLSSCFVL